MLRIKKINKDTLLITGLILLAVLFVAIVVFFTIRSYQQQYRLPIFVDQEKTAELEQRRQENLEILAEFPDYYDVLIDMGNIEKRLGDGKKAIEYYQRAWEVIPANSTPLLNVASVYEELGMYDKVYDKLWQAQSVNPAYDFVYERITDFYDKYYTQKKADIPKVYLLGIDNVEFPGALKAGLANWLFNNGRESDALQYYLELQAKKPNDEFIKQRIKEIEERTSQ